MKQSRISIVYRLYRDHPEKGESSNLYNHYKRGLQGIHEPNKSAKLAYAAWLAGRDTAQADQQQTK